MAMTTKLSCMTEAYTSFAGGFSMFNMVMAPPGPLKGLWQLAKWAPWWFADDTTASNVFSGHLFWCLTTWTVTISVHLSQLLVLHLLDFPVPKGHLPPPFLNLLFCNLS